MSGIVDQPCIAIHWSNPPTPKPPPPSFPANSVFYFVKIIPKKVISKASLKIIEVNVHV